MSRAHGEFRLEVYRFWRLRLNCRGRVFSSVKFAVPLIADLKFRRESLHGGLPGSPSSLLQPLRRRTPLSASLVSGHLRTIAMRRGGDRSPGQE